MKAFLPVLAVAALLIVGCKPPSISVADEVPASGGAPDASVPTPDTAPAPPSPSAPDADFGVTWLDASSQPAPVQVDAAPAVCGLETFKLERPPVELMLILDRSGSMNDPAAPGALTTKWADVTSALNEAMTKTNAIVHWGMKAFPTDNVACNVLDGVEVPAASNNQGTVWGQIMKSVPSGNGTPTTAAIQKTVAYLSAHPSPIPRYLIVATDGEPNCRAGGGRVGATDEAGAVLAVAAALQAGYKTFVIGVATLPAAEGVLNDMARAGGAPRSMPQAYYPVASRADLIAALDVITALVTDCNFRLSKAPPSPMDVAVSVGGTRVLRDPAHTGGWDYGAGNESIQLYGAACEQVKNSAGQNVQIVFGCPGVPVPIIE